jgi:hypothetical protein
VDQLEHHLESLTLYPERFYHPEVLVADSRRLPFLDHSFEGVIGSPPYCTRIDYVVATLPELAVLGFSTDEVSDLRRRMLGSPSFNVVPENPVIRSPYALTLLKAISSHHSKASETYYYRFFAKYFLDLQTSLGELDRVCQKSAPIALVVQDSKYKELQVDIQLVLTQMAESIGRSTIRTDFTVPRTLAAINGRSRRYGAAPSRRESVLLFTR